MVNSADLSRKVIEEGAVLVELCDEPELRPHAAVLVVGGDEAQDVVVAKHHRLFSHFGFRI